MTSAHTLFTIMRHGRSEANVLGRIVSDPREGCAGYCLASHGRLHIRQQAEQLATMDNPPSQIICSDFLRCVETADMVGEAINLDLCIDLRLRERHFGDLDMGSDAAYERVWMIDEQDAGHTHCGVESLTHVAERVGCCLSECRRRWPGEHVLIVTHGDTSAVIRCLLTQRSLTEHRALPPLGTGEYCTLSAEKAAW